MAWFQDVSNLVETLFVGYHVGPGGVPRTTETETFTMENTVACPRTFLTIHAYVVPVLRYNKTQHNTEMDKLIARFIPRGFGRLFLYYLVIIRWLERVWAEEVFGPSKSEAYRSQVFVRFAKPMEGPHFSQALYDSTLEGLLIGLRIHDYRQFIKALLRIVLGIDYDEGEDDKIDVTDAAFGHSSDIGRNVYGLSYNDLPNLTSDLLRLHQSYCQRVHRFLGEGEPLPEHVEPLNMSQMTSLFNNMSSLVEDALERNPSEASITSTVVKATTSAIRDGLETTLVPTIRRIISTELSDTISNIPWEYLIGSNTQVPDECEQPVIVLPSTRRALETILGNGTSFKSTEQAQLLQLVLDRQFNVIGILPTGGGKSILYQAPALFEESGITVCIFPFRALTQDQILEATKFGIAVATWPEKQTSGNDDDPKYAQYIPIDMEFTGLVCVSAHYAGKDDFFPWLKSLHRFGILNRVAVDEVHQFVISEYRSCMPNIRKIQLLDVPIVCLSGSLTPAAIPPIMDFFGFQPDRLRIIRAMTPRPSISFHTIRVSESELYAAVKAEIEGFPLEEHERGLVFCNSYKECEELSKITGLPVYYGRLDEKEKDTVADNWRSGETPRIICTCGFGNGVNYPYCRHGVHVRDPKRMERYVQEVGRLGRDGKRSRAVLFYTHTPSASNIPPPDVAGEIPMIQYLSRPSQCKRIEQSRWSDGPTKVHTCSSLPNAELCDWCEVRQPSLWFFFV